MVELGVCFFLRTSAMESLTAPVSLSYSKVGFRRTQGLEYQPVGVLIFERIAF